MDNKQIGEKIRQLREKKGWKQNQLANKAGISPTYIYQLEAGLKNPTVQYLEYICNELGVTLQQFFANENELHNKIDQLTPHQKDLLNDFLNSL